MTSKEEAKELVEKFGGYKTKTGFIIVDIERAKQCALICVDWHLKEFIETYGDDLIDNIEYWQEVKQEIKELQL